MNKKMTTSLFSGVLALLLILTVSGCGRKHIVSSPPSTQPARQAEPAPAPKPEVVQEKPVLSDETYVVDAPEEAPAAIIKEGDLDVEPVIAPTTAGATATAGAAAVSVTAQPVAEPATGEKTAVPEPVVQAVPSEMYYVQIGAFSDLENANRALARLLSDGYKGSQLSKTEEGLFRVQAGAFPDKASANEALSKLLTDYPKGFVLSTPVNK